MGGINAEAAGWWLMSGLFRWINGSAQIPYIYAVGDIVGDPMLAHKATHEAGWLRK